MPSDANDHAYFLPVSYSGPTRRSREVAAYLLNTWLGLDYSISKWRKQAAIPFEWNDKNNVSRVAAADFRILVSHLSSRRTLNPRELGLPYAFSPLFDHSVDVGLPQCFVGSDGATLKVRLPTAMGEYFPIVPMIDREGFAMADMQSLVELNLVELFNEMLSTSHLAPQPRSGWLTKFRLFVSDCVTAVEIMLHKIYLLAQYRAKDFGWTFSESALGPRHGTRVLDKFRWVSMISGRPFALRPNTYASFKKLKELRNHLSHFDPPCFAATLVEVCSWLNQVRDIAEIIWSIRRHFRQQLSESTVALLLLPEVQFSGIVPFNRVVPAHDSTIGYASASWPSTSA